MFRIARIAGVESEMELPFAGLHQLCAPMLDRLGALPQEDARALLATVIPGRLDARVRDRLVAETRGNPLAILELLPATQLPHGFGLLAPHALSSRDEEVAAA